MPEDSSSGGAELNHAGTDSTSNFVASQMDAQSGAAAAEDVDAEQRSGSFMPNEPYGVTKQVVKDLTQRPPCRPPDELDDSEEEAEWEPSAAIIGGHLLTSANPNHEFRPFEGEERRDRDLHIRSMEEAGVPNHYKIKVPGANAYKT